MLLEVRDTIDKAAAVAMLRAVEPHSVDGATVDEMTAGCLLLDVVEEGQVVGAVAVEIEGQGATITAAASHGEASFRALGLVEGLLKRAGVSRVGMVTKRFGLVHRLGNIGYSIEHCRMAKEI